MFKKNVYYFSLEYGCVKINYYHVKCEITTFRIEGEYLDYRHPSSLRFTDKIEDDVIRRDFTCNALYMDKDENIIDLVKGKSDILTNTLRMIGDPKLRINEDKLRVLRGLNLYSRFNLLPDNTLNLVLQNKNITDDFDKLSNNNIKEELIKILSGNNLTKVVFEYKHILSKVLNIFSYDDIIVINGDYLFSLSLLYFNHQEDIEELSTLFFNMKEIKFIQKAYEIINNYSSYDDIDKNKLFKVNKNIILFIIKILEHVNNSNIHFKQIINDIKKYNFLLLVFYTF